MAALNIQPRQRIKLVQKKDGGLGIFAASAFGAQFVANFSAGNRMRLASWHFAIRNQRQETRLGKILNRRAGVGMAQHALRREHDQRLAPGRRTCRRSMWKYCAAVEGWQI